MNVNPTVCYSMSGEFCEKEVKCVSKNDPPFQVSLPHSFHVKENKQAEERWLDSQFNKHFPHAHLLFHSSELKNILLKITFCGDNFINFSWSDSKYLEHLVGISHG